MKKILPIIVLLIISSQSRLTFAATTPSPSQAQSKLIEQINDLKEKIASKVSQLNLVDKRAIVGTITEISSTQISINDLNNETRYVDVDEITKFTPPTTNTSFGISDLKKNNLISVLGLYNKDSKRITARFIEVITKPIFLSGTVLANNQEGNYITLLQEEGKQTKVDIETTTKTSTFTHPDALEKAGMSKLTPGSRITLVGTANKTDSTRVSATRIIIFSDIAKNPSIVIPDGKIIDESTSPVTASGSGKKLTPLR